MSTMSARRKAMRGTKRTCQACEVRSYDLARSPTVCPTCGVHYEPPAEPIVQEKARSASFAGKTGWRTQPALGVGDVTPGDHADTAVVGDETEETASVVSENSGILELETDDGGTFSPVDLDAADAKDR